MAKYREEGNQALGSQHRSLFPVTIRLSLLGLLLLQTPLLFGQQQAVHWYFGENAGLQFESASFQVKALKGTLSTLEGCSSISDSTGRLLF